MGQTTKCDGSHPIDQQREGQRPEDAHKAIIPGESRNFLLPLPKRLQS
jgi:hypothetical protein